MSEKRFVIDEEGISDNKTDRWYCFKEEYVVLLNELNDENGQLKKKMKILFIHLMSDTCNLSDGQIRKIRKELENVR